MKTLKAILIIGLLIIPATTFAHTTMGYEVSMVHPSMHSAGQHVPLSYYLRPRTKGMSVPIRDVTPLYTKVTK